MKKALFKDSVKEIKNTYKRFLSILLMAFLGVGFFAGIKATSPDMVNTIDQYYKNQNVYDIQVMSTLGLTNQDIEALEQVEQVEYVEGVYETDGKIYIDNKEVIAKIMCIENENKPVLKDGKLLENQEECVVEEKFLEENGKQIGDKIQIEIEDIETDDGEKKSFLKQKELTIVGTVQSPLYISRDRGNTSLGAGKVNYYIYVDKDNTNDLGIFTTAYIKVKDSNNYVTSSDKYENYIKEVKNKIEEIKEEREKERYEKLKENADNKIKEAEIDLNEEKEKAQKELNDAEIEIENGKQKIEKSEIEINQNRKKAEKEFSKIEEQLKTAKIQIEENESNLIGKEKELNEKLSELEIQKQSLETQVRTINSEIEQINIKYNEVIEKLNDSAISEDIRIELEGKKQELENQITNLEANKKTIESTLSQISLGITQAKTEFESGEKRIENAKKELEKKEIEFEKSKNNTYSKIETGEEELEKAKTKIKEGEEELNNGKQEFEEKIAEAEEKLVDAKAKVEDIGNSKWYILDREGNSGYNGFIQDTESISNIGKVFPVVFFIVATLISLTSMTRMVEEQRLQIGTLKALGYNKFQIAGKYILYASLACVVGGILGMSVGFVLLPKVIWMLYGMMYQISDICLSFNWLYGGTGLVLISICIIGATIYAVMKELISEPATLMRPKAPKMGKRVFLEKIPFVWKKLSFSQKVTIRNIFRYKKRVLMTIIGILGCTSLILVGFGIKDSIKQMIPNQYGKIFQYDMQITLKNGLEEKQKEEYLSSLKENAKIEKAVEVYMTSATAENDGKEQSVQIIVPKEENELDGIMNRFDIKTKQEVGIKEDEILLTEKVAELLNIKQGDTLILKDSEENEKEVKVANILENYISHYVYMSKELYEKLYEKEYKTNIIVTKNVDMDTTQEENLTRELLGQKEVASVVGVNSMTQKIDDMMNLLNYVVIILIISAGLLAFVVLYNLANINISERIRELATIKVLGFYDKEVYLYVARETVILTIIGIVLGLLGGYFLTHYIIKTCELEVLRFGKQIQLLSYIYSALITVGFSFIVNVVTYFALKKIDMIESLKSVE